jgi:secretion/DNA translocation related CpaE-like protein
VVDPNRPVAFVADEPLLDDVQKVAAAAGCDLECVSDVAAVRQRWGTAPLVVLDGAAAALCQDAGLARREALVLVSPPVPPPQLWQQAVAIGAERVVELPEAESWLVSALADAVEAPASAVGKVVAVLGGRGGAGASVLTAALGITVSRAGGNALLVDCDPLGGGLDLVLGAETEEGLRWPDLHLRSGRIAASSLHAALPGREHGAGRLTVLSGARRGTGPEPDAVAAVVSSGRRAGETVICDVPRHLGDAGAAALDRADLVIIVVPAEVRACVAARLVAQLTTDRGATPHVVVRGPAPGGLQADEVAESLNLPLLTSMRPEPHLDESLDRGEFTPRPTGPLSRAAKEIVHTLATTHPHPTTLHPAS